MAKLTLNLDERALKNGMAQIRIRISHRGTNAFIPTAVYVEPQYFIPGSLYDPIHRKAYMAVEKREQLAGIVRKVDEFLAEVDPEELAQMTANDIRKCAGVDVRERAQVRKTKSKNTADFMAWFDKYGKSRQTPKTCKSYEYAWNVLHDFCKYRKTLTLSFTDIDYSLLADFAQWLRATGRGESTRHMLESYVRAAYKEAMKCHMVSRELDPYFDYSIKAVPQKDIDALTLEQMHALITTDMPTDGGKRAKDIVLISFYLCGANLLDIYQMDAAVGDEVVFIRHKTQRANMRPTRIRIEPELKVLLNKYKGENALLYFRERYANYETFQRRVIRQMELVTKELGFEVSFAKVRRAWSSIAGSLDIPDRVIDKSMGHVDTSVKDKHYEQYDWSRTARANRAVIDAVMKG